MIFTKKMKKIQQLISTVILLFKKKIVLLAAFVILILLSLSGVFMFRVLAGYFLPSYYVHSRLKKLFFQESIHFLLCFTDCSFPGQRVALPRQRPGMAETAAESRIPGIAVSALSLPAAGSFGSLADFESFFENCRQ
jgi:hypothetical protein